MQHWQGKVVIVTGASSGLGREIAAAFAAHGARTIIAARGAEALERVAAELRAAGRSVLAVPTDVTRQDEVERLIARTLDCYGRIDVLVNNAGRSMRRAVLDTTPEDFQALWDVNFLGAVRATRAAMPHLVKVQGYLVNIGSLAGKAAARWIGAYPATKFALTAYTQQLRLELGPQGLHVLLVCPGPIASAEPRQYSEAELASLPESARRPGAGVKTRALDPRWLAERIVTACTRRESELVFPAKARLLFAVSQFSPRLGDWLIKRMT